VLDFSGAKCYNAASPNDRKGAIALIKTEALDAYRAARKKGLKTYRDDVDHGRYPYVQALDECLDGHAVLGRIELGVCTVPIERIVGTVNAGRRTAFASDFMPLLEPDTEFGAKWIALCDAHLSDEGIHDPIRCFEYYGDFYVQEGNKRLSVLKHFGAPSVACSVLRIVPPESDDPKTRLYYAFLSFYHLSRTYAITFQTPERYQKLIAALGFEPDAVWTDAQRQRVLSGFTLFSNAAARVKLPDGVTVSDAFLNWLSAYSLDDLKTLSPEQLALSIGASAATVGADVSVTTEAAPPSKGVLAKLYDAMFLPTHLHAAFVHEYAPEASNWTHAHEQGRLFAESALSGRVTTAAYTVDAAHDADACFEQAIRDGAQIVFATTPSLIASCRRAAAAHPDAKILNCSVAMPYPGVRTYYSRIYESKFLSGVVAGACSHSDRIGYVAAAPIFGVPASINAFALGARLVNPRAVVKLRWSCTESDPFSALQRDGVDVISNHELFAPQAPCAPYGLIRLHDNGLQEALAAPYWNWGAFYQKLLSDILEGHWEDESANRSAIAVNYWWGMQSGTVGITLAEKLPEGVRTLTETLARALSEGRLNPFRRVMSDQDGIVRNDGTRWLSPAEILHMDWLSDTVEGGIPAFSEILPMAQNIVRLEGIYREDLPPQKDGLIL